MSLEVRYRSIHASGLGKLISGDFTIWNGLPPDDRFKPIVAAGLLISPGMQYILNRIAASAQESEVEICLVGRDLPLYVALKKGKMEESPQKGVNLRQGRDWMGTVATRLLGEVWQFNHLALGPNTILGSENSASVISVREQLDGMFTTRGLVPVEIDCLYCTIARVVSFKQVSCLKSFAEKLLEIRKHVSAVPLQLKVDSIYTGTMCDLLTQSTM